MMKPLDVEGLVKAICCWCGKTAEHESLLLTRCPRWQVDAKDLLDLIHSETGISKQQLGEWVEQGRVGL